MEKLILIYTIYIISCGLMASNLLAVEDKPLSLKELLTTAAVKNPKIKASEQEVLAYSFRIKPAQTLPDPMIEIGIKHMGLSEWMIGKDPSSGIMFSLSQMFPLYGKLHLAGDIARQAHEGRLHALEATKLDIFKQVKMAYFDLYYAYQAVNITEKQKELMQKVLVLTETRYAVGSGIQSDIFKTQLEISRMDEMIIPMKEMIKMKEATINLLLNYPADHPLDKPEAIACETIPVSLAQLQETLLKQSPRLKEAEAMAAERSLMVTMARKEFKPDVTVNATYEYKGKLPAMVQLMLGVTIPLFAGRKQFPRWHEAQALAESAKQETSFMTNDMQMVLNDNFLRAKTSANLIQLYKTRIIPPARLALESSFSAYPVNKTDFMALLSDISTQFSAELAYQRELVQLWNALAVIESITASPLLPIKE